MGFFNYALSGNNLIGKVFQDTIINEGVKYAYSTSVRMLGDNLVVTGYQSYSGGNSPGWERAESYFKKYLGAIPPSEWPTNKCDSNSGLVTPTILDKRLQDSYSPRKLINSKIKRQ